MKTCPSVVVAGFVAVVASAATGSVGSVPVAAGLVPVAAGFTVVFSASCLVAAGFCGISSSLKSGFVVGFQTLSRQSVIPVGPASRCFSSVLPVFLVSFGSSEVTHGFGGLAEVPGGESSVLSSQSFPQRAKPSDLQVVTSGRFCGGLSLSPGGLVLLIPSGSCSAVCNRLAVVGPGTNTVRCTVPSVFPVHLEVVLG